MRQNLTKGKIAGSLMAAILAFLAISCSSFGGLGYILYDGSEGEPQQPPDPAPSEASDSQEPQDVSEIKNPYGKEQMQELYHSLEKAIRANYLEPNHIPPESFRWPEYKVLSNGIIWDEDHAWSYFNNIAINYSQSGTLYDTKGFMYDLPEKTTRQLMDALLDGLVEWSEGCEEGDAFQKARDAIFPEYENLPRNIDFSSQSGKGPESLHFS